RSLPRARAGTRCPTPPSAPRCARRSWAGPPARSFGGGRPRLLRVPGGEHEAGGAVLAVTRDLVLLQRAEGLGRVVRPPYVGRVEDVAQLVVRQPVGAGIPGVELGPKHRAPALVPGEGRAVVAEVARERRHAVAGVSEV